VEVTDSNSKAELVTVVRSTGPQVNYNLILARPPLSDDDTFKDYRRRRLRRRLVDSRQRRFEVKVNYVALGHFVSLTFCHLFLLRL